MGKYELLEHTADVGVVATGESLADALSALATGMFSVVADLDTVRPTQSAEVSVTSANTDGLVVDWLNELLYTYDAHGFLPKRFDVTVDQSGMSLVARCSGEPVDRERHIMLTDVKAATYHGLDVKHNSEWRIRVVLDV